MPGRQVDVEQLNDLLSGSSAHCFIVDREGRFVSDAARVPGPGTPASLFEAYGGDPPASAALERLLTGSEVAFTVTRADVAYAVRAQPLRDEHGRPDGAIGVATVVADEPRLRRQLAESETRLRQLIDSNVIGVLFWERGGQISGANDAFLEMVGYSRQDLDEGRLDWGSMTPPEHVELDRIGLREIDDRGHCTPFEKEYVRKDGERVPVLIAGASLDAGRSRGIAFVLDESRRKAEERQRRAVEAQLRHAVEHAPFILWSLDEKGVFTLAEGRGLAAIGRKPGEAVGHSAFELYKDLPDVVGYIRRALAGEEFTYLSDVRGRLFETRTFPVRDGRGNWAGFTAVSLDVTERQRAEAERAKKQEQLLERQKLESLGVLAGGIAHDFNNILTVIMGAASEAAHRSPEGSAARESIDHVTDAARRAADLTHQMLAYAGKAHFEVRSIDLSQHVREITTLLETTVSKKARLCLSIASDLPAIRADSAQIQQVVMNLVLNAAEAIGDRSGTVTVTTGVQQIDARDVRSWSADSLTPGSFVFVEVADTGAGMDAATRARVFDPFFTTKFAGRGLGLSAVLGIVRAHGGAIRIESTVGVGTSFRVAFPSAGPMPAQRAEAPGEYRGGGLVLLVDDDDRVRRVMRAMLEHLGFGVVEAEDGRQALEVLRERMASIAVVVLDMTMPEMGGEEAFVQIRAMSDVPVILTSGYAESNPMPGLALEPAAVFLRKPFTGQQLADKLRLALESNASGAPSAQRQ